MSTTQTAERIFTALELDQSRDVAGMVYSAKVNLLVDFEKYLLESVDASFRWRFVAWDPLLNRPREIMQLSERRDEENLTVRLELTLAD